MLVINGLNALDGGGRNYLKHFFKWVALNYYEKIVFITTTATHEHLLCHYKNLENVSVLLIERKNVVSRAIWEIIFLPGLLKRLGATTYFAPGGLMLTRTNPEVVSVTMLRNMLPFSKYGNILHSGVRHGLKNCILRVLYLLSYRLSDKIVFISAHSHDVVTSFDHNLKEKCFIIPHGVERLSDELVKVSVSHSSRPYFLYVSSYYGYKNHIAVLTEFQKYVALGGQSDIVFVGSNFNSPIRKNLQKTVDVSELNHRVQLLPPVDQDSLNTLYCAAESFIFASSCECCPNILLEKARFGKRLFCNIENPMPEFAPRESVFFDITQPGDLAMRLVEHDNSEVRIVHSREHHNERTWDDSIGEIMNLFKQ